MSNSKGKNASVKIKLLINSSTWGFDEVKIRWLEKSVDLSTLVERIRLFFHDLDFETSIEKVQEGYVILAVSKIPNLRLRNNVNVLGEPNDFTVEFLSGGKGGHFSPLMVAGYLTSIFGGGYLIRREAERRETLDRLESWFWKHVQTQVADLTGSATKTKR